MLNTALRLPISQPLPDKEILGWVREALSVERNAIDAFLRLAPEALVPVINVITDADRPVALIGMGKSGHVAAKIAATLSSLGTPAFFLNAGEAAHGDLGAVQSGTTAILLSNSGTTEEILRILPALKTRGCCLIGLIGRADSPLGRAVDHLIPTGVALEADPIGMAPTASTTLQMAVGDAIAIAVSRRRGFGRADFLAHHPAGLLGRHMIPVRSLMRSGEAMPAVLPQSSAAEMLAVISAGRLGAACVIDWQGRLQGLITDGDIRRLIQARRDLYAISAHEIMRPDPQVIAADAVVGDAIALIQHHPHPLSVLPVVNDTGRLEGVLHAYDLMQG